MIHNHIEKFGFCSDIFVPNSLIDSYSNCGLIGVHAARKLFAAMEERGIVSWNSVICGLVKAGEVREARRLFDEMPDRDTVSCNTILDGYLKAGEMDAAFELFQKMPNRDVVSWSTMICGCCKAGDMEMARIMFDKMPGKNLVRWTIIISGYAEKGMAKDAISLFDKMEEAGLKPDHGVVISILAACAESGLIGLGEKVHTLIQRMRFRCRTHVSNALVDMYAKFGSLNWGLCLFNGMKTRDLVSWNAMIQGLAMHGLAEEALEIFSRMKQKAGDWNSVASVRMQMKNTGTQKQSGASSIELDDEVHEFTILDTSHPKSDSLYQMIDGLGAVPKCWDPLDRAVPRVIRELLQDGPLVGSDHKDTCLEHDRSITKGLKGFHPFEMGCHLGSAAADDDSKPVHDADWRSFRARLVAGEGALRPELGKPSSVVDPDSVLDQPPCVTIGDKWAHTIHRPEKGCLLIATQRSWMGPHLRTDGGPAVVDRSAGTFSDRPLFFGGPLEEGLFLVKGGGDGVGRSGVFDEVMKGLYYGTKESVGCAAEMVKRNVVGVGDFRFFDGYCGWDMEQLMDEVRAGYWTVAACSSSVIGLASIGSVELWEEVLGLVGPKKGLVSSQRLGRYLIVT
ncbi:tetratricopeptide repeat (TPR)-like superfamily protein [Actinidia rufa]|uniref:Tetratricopeptide repeat (TPR)-like superfamily protein n=1 Tax=Actinidia rufa TaxID=165716 RepID=A0A7J0DEG0_9ERIC|nr:tetratricopeptide repeat (TPR)-like superfamily protein [Actinidia rufa]